jgi:N utilization substance protein B
MTGSRRKAREVALQALYWSESSGDPVHQTLLAMAARAQLSEDAAEFAQALGRETWTRKDELNRMVEGISRNWALERISRIDRILLWMALTEMLAFDNIPVKVSMNEAIELAKRYSVEKAPTFINGILDALVRQQGIITNPMDCR